MKRAFEGVKWLAEGVITASFKRKENPATRTSVESSSGVAQLLLCYSVEIAMVLLQRRSSAITV